MRVFAPDGGSVPFDHETAATIAALQRRLEQAEQEKATLQALRERRQGRHGEA